MWVTSTRWLIVELSLFDSLLHLRRALLHRFQCRSYSLSGN
jgi:hypothetical protein